MPGVPSPMDLAREAARREKEEAISTHEQASTDNTPLQSASSAGAPASAAASSSSRRNSSSIQVKYDLSAFEAGRNRRVNRTFSIGEETDMILNEAALRLNTNKSGLIDAVIKNWWEAIKPTLK